VGRGEDAADLLVAAVIQPVGPEVQGLYDSAALRGFVNIDLGREQVPVETTVCKFRHLLEEHPLGARIFEQCRSAKGDMFSHDHAPTHTTFVFDSGISRTRFPVAA